MGTERPTASRLALVAGFAVIYVVWGSTYVAIGLGVRTLPPFLMAGTRFLLSAAVLGLWAYLRGDARPTRRQWRNAAAAGVLMFVGGNGGVSFAQKVLPSGLVALVVATVPAWLALFDWAGVSGRRPRARELAGIALGLGGVGALATAEHAPGVARPDMIGLVIAASAAWAAGSLFARGADLPRSPVSVTAMEMLAGGVAVGALGLATGEAHRFDPAAVDNDSVWAFAYLLVAGLVALPTYTWLLTVTSPALVGTYAFVNPVVAVLLGWAVLGESLSGRALAAAALVVGGVVLITWPNAGRSRPE
jgi:drug/metabolite transporter (DMT)-like permease